MAKFIVMKKTLLIICFFGIITACNQSRDTRGIPGPEEVKAMAPDTVQSVEEQAEKLLEKGYKTFLYEEEGEKHLMQQYYIVFLKRGQNRSQDSTEAAKLQRQHLAHLDRMAKEGFLSLAGPFEDDGEIRGIAVYNTPTQKIADSLANLDPMVRAGRLEIEIHPWWAAKGSKLE
jgi:uncharacterized protein